MDALDAIFSRRSIRRFTDQDVTDEQIKTLIKAGMAGPTTVHNNDWAFAVMRKQENKELVMRLKPGNADMLQTAPVAIVVCGDLQLAYRGDAGYWEQDCAAAAENILIAATAMGLGSVWLGIHPNRERAEALRDALSLPAHIIPFCVIALGYAAEQKPPHDRYEEEKVYYDSI